MHERGQHVANSLGGFGIALGKLRGAILATEFYLGKKTGRLASVNVMCPGIVFASAPFKEWKIQYAH